MLAGLTEQDLSLTSPAQDKMGELFAQVDDAIQGVRVFATPGGCSGISFGMTFTDSVNDNDGVLDVGGFKVIVDDGTLQHLRGVEIDSLELGPDLRQLGEELRPLHAGLELVGVPRQVFPSLFDGILVLTQRGVELGQHPPSFQQPCIELHGTRQLGSSVGVVAPDHQGGAQNEVGLSPVRSCVDGASQRQDRIYLRGASRR